MKPFVLAEAIKQGISVQSSFKAPGEIVIPHADGGGPWDVHNYGGESFGVLDLVHATQNSVNTVYAQLMVDVDAASRSCNLAQQMGVKSPLDPVNALVLGSEDVSPLDMASAYSTFADRGTHVDPIGILAVERPDGSVVDFTQPRPRPTCSPQRSRTRSRTASARSCSAAPAPAPTPASPVAGKTGTTQDNKDAWFVGYAPNGFTTAVWMGYPNAPGTPTRYMDDVHGKHVTGGPFPATIWRKFMQAALGGAERRHLRRALELPGRGPEPRSVAVDDERTTSSTTSSTDATRRRRPSRRRTRPTPRRRPQPRPRRPRTEHDHRARRGPSPSSAGPATVEASGRRRTSATCRRGRTGGSATTRRSTPTRARSTTLPPFPRGAARAAATLAATARPGARSGPARRRGARRVGRPRLPTCPRSIFDSEPAMSVPGLLLVPDGRGARRVRPCSRCTVTATRRRPSAGSTAATPSVRAAIDARRADYGHRLAQQGYVVLATDHRGFGERADALVDDRYFCDLNLVHAVRGRRQPARRRTCGTSAARSTCSPRIRSSTATRSASSGGRTAARSRSSSTAVDDRVAAAVVCGAFASFRAMHLVPGNLCGSQVLGGMLGPARTPRPGRAGRADAAARRQRPRRCPVPRRRCCGGAGRVADACTRRWMRPTTGSSTTCSTAGTAGNTSRCRRSSIDGSRSVATGGAVYRASAVPSVRA